MLPQIVASHYQLQQQVDALKTQRIQKLEQKCSDLLAAWTAKEGFYLAKEIYGRLHDAKYGLAYIKISNFPTVIFRSEFLSDEIYALVGTGQAEITHNQSNGNYQIVIQNGAGRPWKKFLGENWWIEHYNDHRPRDCLHGLACQHKETAFVKDNCVHVKFTNDDGTFGRLHFNFQIKKRGFIIPGLNGEYPSNFVSPTLSYHLPQELLPPAEDGDSDVDLDEDYEVFSGI